MSGRHTDRLNVCGKLQPLRQSNYRYVVIQIFRIVAGVLDRRGGTHRDARHVNVRRAKAERQGDIAVRTVGGRQHPVR